MKSEFSLSERRSALRQRLANSQRFHSILLEILFVMVVATVTLVVSSNSIQALPVFLFILVLTLGLCLQASQIVGLLVVLVGMVAWIVVKRSMGVWTRELMLVNLFELAGLFACAVVAGVYRARQVHVWKSLSENQRQLSQLEIEDASLGLLRLPIGKLRLTEEIERAYQHHQPLTLLFLLVQEIPGQLIEVERNQLIVQAVATLLKDAAGEMDIPFSIDMLRMGLIMPNAGISDAQKLLDRLSKNLQDGHFVTSLGQSQLLRNYGQIRYGFATFLGQADEPPDIFASAELSLQQNVASNQGLAFQNLFIDWIKVGQEPEKKSAVLNGVIDGIT